MTKNKLHILLIAGLLLTNILLVVFIMRPKGGPPHKRPMPREIIIERLHFNEAQIQQYETLIQQHRKQITEKERGMMDLKNQLYAQLSDNQPHNNTDSLASAIGSIQHDIELIHHGHFADIKKLCTPEQMNDFNELVSELAQMFSHPPPPKH